MKLTPFIALFFFVCVNLSLYLMTETHFMASTMNPPYETPESLGGIFHFDLSTGNLLVGGGILGVGLIMGWITGKLIYGGTVAIILFGLDLVLPIVKWLILGLPIFLGQIGVHPAITLTVGTLLTVIFFWFFLSMLVQRPLET